MKTLFSGWRVYVDILLALLVLTLIAKPELPVKFNLAVANALGMPARNAQVEAVLNGYVYANPGALDDLNVTGAHLKAEQLAKVRALPAVSLAQPRSGYSDVYEFFDYNCGYCRQFSEQIAASISPSDRLNLKAIQFPVLGKDSVDVAKIVIGSGRFGEELQRSLHKRLLSHRDKLTEKAAIDELKGLGVSEDSISKLLASLPGDGDLGNMVSVGKALGISGTPSFVVGDKILRGVQTKEMLLEALASTKALP